jgi:hypothetical protein
MGLADDIERASCYFVPLRAGNQTMKDTQRAALLEELRFIKRHQLTVAGGVVAILGAALGLKNFPLTNYDKGIVTALILLLAGGAIAFLFSLHGHMARTRKLLDPDDTGAWSRGSPVLGGVIAVIVVTTAVVVYLLWRF